MANKTVSLVRKCKTPAGWRRYPVAMSANGRVKPDTIVVEGSEITFAIGHYELRSYKGSKVAYERVDGGATEALAALKIARRRSHAIATAASAGVQTIEESCRTPLRVAFPKFVQAALDRGSDEAAEVYGRSIGDFLDGCSKMYTDEVTREDISKFHNQMRKRGLSKRTVHNRHQSLRAFFLSLRMNVAEIAGKAPRFDKTMPEIYEPDQLTSLFLSPLSDCDRLLFDMLLKTGLREREAMHLEWGDISVARRTLQVKSKPVHGHRIKDAEEREMALPADLIVTLAHYRQTCPESVLVFGKRGGKVDSPDGHLLRRLKRAARDAGMNCEKCSGCVSNSECEVWFLHRFRATYATTLLRSGMDLRTVQRLMGHSDLASTMRYLRPAGTDEVQDRVNAIVWH
jgi:integrase